MIDVARSIFIVVFILAVSACDPDSDQTVATSGNSVPAAPVVSAELVSTVSPIESLSDVEAVSVSGAPGSYTFSVTVSSPDTGCDHYADWWEVLSESGDLLYRRVLLHSHVDEQPFTRTCGPEDARRDKTVIARAHMNLARYGGVAMRGSLIDGFNSVILTTGFGDGVETMAPLPDGCAF